MSQYQYNKTHLSFKNSKAIDDSDVANFLKKLNFNINDVLRDENVTNQFCSEYVSWIRSGKLNTIIGLDEFKFASFSQATTEAFDKFYIKNSKRRFRCFRGEYLYHSIGWRTSHDWCYIEDDNLKSNDAVVISVPFADTGNEHVSMVSVLNRCSELNIPVLIDCVYYTISSGTSVDLTYSCITDVTFSLSKTFPVAHARIGVRLTREDCDDLLFVYEKSGYTNRLSARLGLELIRQFSVDYMVEKYKSKQEKICDYLGISPSKTVLFGIAPIDKFVECNRGGNTNRLGLNAFLTKDLSELQAFAK